jgi:hypothetical protein
MSDLYAIIGNVDSNSGYEPFNYPVFKQNEEKYGYHILTGLMPCHRRCATFSTNPYPTIRCA